MTMIHGLVVQRHPNLRNVLSRDVIVLSTAFKNFSLINRGLQNIIFDDRGHVIERIILDTSVLDTPIVGLPRRCPAAGVVFDLRDEMDDLFLHNETHVLHFACCHQPLFLSPSSLKLIPERIL